QNVTVEYHWLEGHYERLPALLADLVRRRVAVIATLDPNSALPAKAATTTIPIVFAVGEDPVALGLVTSFAHPGGNATGINFFTNEVNAKRLGLMHELLRKATRFAALLNPANAASAPAALKTVKEAAHALGLEMLFLNVNPVRLGLVPNLNRPGGNVTDATQLNVAVSPKRLELLHELLPTATVLAMLIDPSDPASAEVTTRSLQAAAHTLGLTLHVLSASTEAEFDQAFAKLKELGARGLVIGGSAFFVGRDKQLAALAARYGVPTIFETRGFIAAGVLMSYGGAITEAYRLAGSYTGRVLKGEKVGELPVQQSTKVEMFLNLKTAK